MSCPRAVVLLSGGLDSCTCLGIAIQEGFAPIGLSFKYGQRHAVELAAAESIAKHYKLEKHKIVELDLRLFGASALTDEIPVPKNSDLDSQQIPITYVPARNTIFLSFAVALAEVSGAQHIFIGVNAVDYSGYPDCRPEYIEAFERVANLATKSAVQELRKLTIHTPLIHLAKSEIVQRAVELDVPLHLTFSCYDPGPAGDPCRECDSCRLRARGFNEAGVADPAQFQSK